MTYLRATLYIASILALLALTALLCKLILRTARRLLSHWLPYSPKLLPDGSAMTTYFCLHCECTFGHNSVECADCPSCKKPALAICWGDVEGVSVQQVWVGGKSVYKEYEWPAVIPDQE